MIDFKKLDRADLWIASDEPTPEDDRAFSAFLKAQREKQTRARKASPASATAASPRKKAKAKAR
jgi:hypothetical protein